MPSIKEQNGRATTAFVPTPSNDNLFNEWRTADRNAHALEQAISKASLDALAGHGAPAPSIGDRERARRMRQAADDLFVLAMREMDARVKSLRP